MTTTKKWYAVYTRPKWERKVTQIMTMKNIEAYCPLNKVQKQWSDRKKIILEPLFNSYVFIYATEHEHALIKSSDGVINFVYWLGSPAVIRDEEIKAIRDFIEDHENVTVEKAVVNINDRIVITNGALMNSEGEVIEIKSRTVKVYLPSLGYQLLAEVDKSSIKVIKKYTHTLAS
jgi:transcription antitermination factor NusG